MKNRAQMAFRFTLHAEIETSYITTLTMQQDSNINPINPGRIFRFFWVMYVLCLFICPQIFTNQLQILTKTQSCFPRLTPQQFANDYDIDFFFLKEQQETIIAAIRSRSLASPFTLSLFTLIIIKKKPSSLSCYSDTIMKRKPVLKMSGNLKVTALPLTQETPSLRVN